jgi:hypothetical protein
MLVADAPTSGPASAPWRRRGEPPGSSVLEATGVVPALIDIAALLVSNVVSELVEKRCRFSST